MREKTKTLIAEALGIELADVNDDALLREDLGLEDLDLHEIIKAVKPEIAAQIAPDDIAKCQQVEELLNLIEQHGPEEL